ncbi:hypothetical protein BpHYR1_018077 [Brachionus plicatilis]|uniref:Uncharacterized protein n=1 Tax=Brachionus plicatilis TaxID=10195 RepID=A0A3M7R7P3_BRAPC|nr:hypothetical protein BpHYR1_018077 [Brachionus plicatilis]
MFFFSLSTLAVRQSLGRLEWKLSPSFQPQEKKFLKLNAINYEKFKRLDLFMIFIFVLLIKPTENFFKAEQNKFIFWIRVFMNVLRPFSVSIHFKKLD